MDALFERHDIFSALNNQDTFIDIFKTYYAGCYTRYALEPFFATSRLRDAHVFWQKDLKRVSEIEYGGKPLDHFKRSGHLCYWLRRSSPIIEAQSISASEERPLNDFVRTMLFRYANEFTAFYAGFRICKFFETKRTDGGGGYDPHLDNLDIDAEYFYTVCHFLKEKNVSPHALYLIYMSLFANLRTARRW